MKRWVGLALLALVSSVPSQASAPDVFFSSQDNIERQILEAISRTNRSIEAAVFNVTSPSLRRALRDAAARGVSVRLITDAHQGTGTATALSDDFLPFLEVHLLAGRSRRGAMHHKFAVFDGARVATGSYNWTPGAQHANYENLLFQDDAEMAMAYHRQFEWLWNQSVTIADVPTRRGARHRHRKRARS